MLFNEAGCCILGSKLEGQSQDIRLNVKTGIIILEDYNDSHLVLKNNCFCNILKEVSGINDEEYKECMRKLRAIGFGPIFDSIGNDLEGRRISCEFNGKPQKPRYHGRQKIVMKSKISVAYISGKERKSGIYVKSDRFILSNK